MKVHEKINVLISPAGSTIAINTIKYLRKDPSIRLIGTDIDLLAPGLYMVDRSYIVSHIRKKHSFFKELIEIISNEDIDIIIPCLDPFLEPFAKWSRDFLRYGAKTLVSPIETVKVSMDKYMMVQKLHLHVNVPETYLFDKNMIDKYKDLEYPLIVKPRYGSGSRNVFIAHDFEELLFFAKRIDQPIIQKYIEGEEYTVDIFVSSNNDRIIVPRKRIETKAGISVKGVIVYKQELVEFVENILDNIEILGPACIQVIESKEDIWLIEINPRICGGMVLTFEAIANFPLLAIYDLLGRDISKYVEEGRKKLKQIRNKKIYFTRFFEHYIVDEDRFKNINILHTENND